MFHGNVPSRAAPRVLFIGESLMEVRPELRDARPFPANDSIFAYHQLREKIVEASFEARPVKQLVVMPRRLVLPPDMRSEMH